jgi:PDZ domain
MTRTLRTLLAVALGTALVPPITAQEREERGQRRELEERLSELRREMRDIERQLYDLHGSADWNFTAPRVLAFSSNRARLGVTVQTRANDETDQVGAVLQSVVNDGPAAKAGLQAGDIITSLNGENLVGRYPPAGLNESEPARKLIDLVGEMKEGDEVQIAYRREGRNFTTTATLEVVEPEWFGVGSPGIDVRVIRPGPGRVAGTGAFAFDNGLITITTGIWSDIELVELSPELGHYFGTDHGLLVVSAPKDIAELHAGDVILGIGGRDAETPSRAMRILRSYDEGEQIEMTVMRDKRQMTLTITVPERHNDFFYEPRIRNFY